MVVTAEGRKLYMKAQEMRKLCTAEGQPCQDIQEYVNLFNNLPFFGVIRNIIWEGIGDGFLGEPGEVLRPRLYTGTHEFSNDELILEAMAMLQREEKSEFCLYHFNDLWNVEIKPYGISTSDCWATATHKYFPMAISVGFLAMSKVNREWEYYKPGG